MSEIDSYPASFKTQWPEPWRPESLRLQAAAVLFLVMGFLASVFLPVELFRALGVAGLAFFLLLLFIDRAGSVTLEQAGFRIKGFDWIAVDYADVAKADRDSAQEPSRVLSACTQHPLDSFGSSSTPSLGLAVVVLLNEPRSGFALLPVPRLVMTDRLRLYMLANDAELFVHALYGRIDAPGHH